MKSRNKRTGITLVHTGDGKGKSSSAFGMVFRAAGSGMKVCVIQFIKGHWKTGEQEAAKQFDNIEWHRLGDGFTWNTQDPEQDKKSCQEAWVFSQQKILSEAFDMVILDEINYCCGYGWLTGQEIADFIRQQKPPWLHLVLTGRNAPQEVIEVADTVTEMKVVKHAFEQGIKAQQGTEF
ncbi:MAG: cob(I)yrinic acid a,c-diamide adenosyltransferase [Candidatus Polarisedimenticolaceae bacterium]|nr:cob(I)yrinic acid a,c-diamide adenosyltransferase [Candidatus Polarisedimenticolaceae bacterium]